MCVALYLSMRHAKTYICKGKDLGVKASSPSSPLPLPLYLGIPSEQAENHGTLPGGGFLSLGKN